MALPRKTSLLETTDALSQEEFGDDLTNLLSLEESGLDLLSGTMVRAEKEALEPSTEVSYKETTALLAKFKKDQKSAASIIRIGSFLIRNLTSPTKRLKPEDIVDDINVVFDLGEKEKALFYRFVSKTYQALEVVIHNRLVIRFEETGIPSFVDVTTAADFRSVVPNFFQYGDIFDELYEPSIRGFVARGTITIRLARAKDSRIAFQVTSDELDYLVDSLKVLQKDLESTKKYMEVHNVKLLKSGEQESSSEDVDVAEK